LKVLRQDLPEPDGRPDTPHEELDGRTMEESNRQVRLLLELYKLQAISDDTDKAEACRKIEESLDPLLLGRYRNLKKRKGNAVAVLKNCTCSECMIMYPETHEILRHKNSVHSCEFCGRLLLVTSSSAQASP
jgi:predicted  nucleic acid-binding Zn-ribbon protein